MYFNLLQQYQSYYELQLNSIYLPYINKNYKCDTFFPKIPEDFKLVEYSKLHYSKGENVKYRFLKYEKNFFYNNDCEKVYLDIAKQIQDWNEIDGDEMTGPSPYKFKSK